MLAREKEFLEKEAEFMWRERRPSMRGKKRKGKMEEQPKNVTIVAASKTFKIKPLKQVRARSRVCA